MNNIYFSGIRVKNIKAFKDEYFFDFSDSEGKPAKWVVIIGNNNTGKTTLLRCVASMQLKKREEIDSSGKLDISYGIEYELLFGKKITPQSEFSFIKAGLIPSSISVNDLADKNRKYLLVQEPSSGIVIDNSWLFGITKYPNGSIAHSYNLLAGELPINVLYEYLKIYIYGTSRRISSGNLPSQVNRNGLENLFSNHTDLMNLESWLTQLDYSTKNNSTTAERLFKRVKDILLNNFFHRINDIRFLSSDDLTYRVEVLINDHWLLINQLGYGYQSTMAWVIDLVKQMYDRYYLLDDPLKGPAIVLVDEIDLHLHPEWQRKIIKYLSDLFPNTQFIVTAHSPLIVQSAEEVNLIMLEKSDETDSINVRQKFGSFQGWTIEEILRELMDMGEKTRSDRYLELMAQFEDGLLAENYAIAKAAYDDLDKILSPSSHQRKVLSIQLSTITPVPS